MGFITVPGRMHACALLLCAGLIERHIAFREHGLYEYMLLHVFFLFHAGLVYRQTKEVFLDLDPAMKLFFLALFLNIMLAWHG